MNYNTKLVKNLRQLDFYRRYPGMCPFVGQDYGIFGKRILFLGESPYLPKGSADSSDYDPASWYFGSAEKLNEDEIGYIAIFDMINERKNQTMEARAWRYYLDMEKSLLEAGYPWRENMFQYVAFMNSFQRPATQSGKSIKHNAMDIEKSSGILKQVMDLICPDLIIFLTKKGGNAFENHLKCSSREIVVCCHTTCSWWNRDIGSGTPRQRCVDTLRTALFPQYDLRKMLDNWMNTQKLEWVRDWYNECFYCKETQNSDIQITFGFEETGFRKFYYGLKTSNSACEYAKKEGWQSLENRSYYKYFNDKFFNLGGRAEFFTDKMKDELFTQMDLAWMEMYKLKKELNLQ